MYKEDLSEFGRTVATDTKKFVSDVSKKVEDVSKQDPSTLAASVTTKIAGSVTEVASGIKSLVSTFTTTVGMLDISDLSLCPFFHLHFHSRHFLQSITVYRVRSFINIFSIHAYLQRSKKAAREDEFKSLIRFTNYCDI